MINSGTIINVLIFVIDDNEIILGEVKAAFEKAGISNVRFFTSHYQMYMELVKEVQIVIIDYYIPGTTGLQIMQKILTSNPHCLPIIMTCQEDPDIIIQLYDNGAFGYVRKDKEGFLDKLVNDVKRATNKINCAASMMQDMQETYHCLDLLFKTCNTPLNGLVTANNTSS